MKFERSAGIIIYRKVNNSVEFLFLLGKENVLDITKGHIEKGESDIKAAERETMEEAGITADIHPGFKRKISYRFQFNGSKIHKDLTIFLGEARPGTVKISDEHRGYVWLTFNSALKKLPYHNYRRILRQAYAHIEIKKQPA